MPLPARTPCPRHCTYSVFDGREVESEETCVESAVDLAPLSPSEESAFVGEKLTGCQNATYPPGTGANDPTGRYPTPSSEGCSVSSAVPGSSVSLFGLVAGGLTLPPKEEEDEDGSTLSA